MSEAAVAAAAIAKQLLDFEEEELTNYSDNDLKDNWEFKIVRSVTGAFRNPIKLQEAINNEKQYGWQLVEKFDNNRIRFKRKVSNNKPELNNLNDPYKTFYGMGPVSFALIILFFTFLGMGLITGLIIFLIP